MTETKTKRLSSIKNIAVTITTGVMSTGLFWGLISCGDAISDPDSLLNAAINNLGSADIKKILDFDYGKKASDEVNAKPKEFFISKIKTLPVFKSLDSNILANFSVDDLDIIFDDTKGLLLITIINHGPILKMISIDGFTTQQDYDDIETFLVNVESDDLEDALDFDYDSKPNEVLQSLDKDNFVEKIKELSEFQSEVFDDFTGDNVSLSVNDETGVLTATINFGDVSKTFDFAGFVNSDEEFISSALDSITEADLDGMFSKNDIPSVAVAKLDMNNFISKIKNLPDVKILGDELLSEITSDNIQLDYDDETGLVEVTIIGFGNEKLFGVPNFLTSSQNEEVITFLDEFNNIGDEIASVLGLDFTLKPTDFTNQKSAEDFLEAIKFSASFNEMSIEAQSFLTSEDLSVEYSDESGVINLQITHQNETHILPLGPFKTTASADLESALATITQRDLSNALAFNTKKLPTDPENNKSELLVSEIIKNLPQIKVLENAELILPQDISIVKNETTGEIDISINNHGPKLTYKFIGFVKNDDISEFEQAILTMEPSEEFAAELGFDKKETPTSDKNQISVSDLVFRLKKSSYFRNLALGESLSEDNLKIAFDDVNGVVTFRISAMGAENEIVFKGFLNAEEKELNSAIQNLTENILLPLIPFDKKSLPTDEINNLSPQEMIEIIKNIPQFQDLSGIDLLVPEDLLVDANNETGEIELTIKNHGNLKRIVFHDFVKKSNLVLNDYVQSLNLENIKEQINFDYDNLPSAPNNLRTKEDVFKIIRNDSKFLNLPLDVQNELLPTDISVISNDDSGKISIVIKHHGESKLLEFIDFGTNDDLNNLNNVIQSLTANDVLLNSLGLDRHSLPSDNFENISEVELLNNFRNSEEITNLKLKNLFNQENVKWKYDDISGKVYLIINVNNQYKEIEFEGFITQNQAELNEKIQLLESADIEANLSFDKNALPSSSSNIKTPEKVLDILKNSEELKNLNGIDNLKREDISLEYDNNSGLININIQNHGPTKTLVYKGFINQADENLNNFIHSLQSDELVSELNFDNDLKASNVVNYRTSENIYEIIKNLPGFQNLDQAAQDAFFATDIWTDYNDDDGQISIVIKHHGEPQVLNYLGFVTNTDESELKMALQNTEVDANFEAAFNFDKTNVPTDERNFKNKDEFLADFLSLSRLKDLRLSNELTTNDIEIGADDQNGILILKVHYLGETFEFDIPGFVNPEEYEFNKQIASLTNDDLVNFLNFDESKLPSSSANQINKDNLANFIKNLDDFKNLGQTEEFSGEDILLNYDDDLGQIQIMFQQHGSEKKLVFSNFINKTNWETKEFIENIDIEKLSTLMEMNKDRKASDDSNQLTKEKVLEAISQLEEFSNLSKSAQDHLSSINLIFSRDDENGTVVIKIHDGKFLSDLKINGFVTNDDEKTLDDLIQNLTPEILEENLNLNRYFSVENVRNQFTLEEYLQLIKSSALFNDAKAKELLVVSDLNMTKDLSGGTIFITISNHGKNKIVAHSGFANEDTSNLNEKISNIKVDDLQVLMNLSNDKLPSDASNSRSAKDIINAIKKIPEFSDLPAINELVATDIDIEINDELGKMVITIKNHGDIKLLEITDFADINNNALNNAINDLTEGQLRESIKFNFEKKSSQFLESFTKEMAIDIFKKQANINSLSTDQKINLVPENFSFEADDQNGILKLHFKNNFYEKTWNFNGFVSDQDVTDFYEAIANLEASGILINNLGFDLKQLPTSETNSLSSEEIRNVFLELDSFKNLRLKNNLKAADIEIIADDQNGTIFIQVKNGDVLKKIEFSGFLNADDKRLNDEIAAISADDLDSIIPYSKNKLPDDELNKFSSKEFLAFVLDLPGIKVLENKNDLKESDFQISYQNEAGEIHLKISNHGSEKNIIFENFLTSDEKNLNDAIAALNSSEIEKVFSFDKEKLSSYFVNDSTKQNIVESIRLLPGISNLKNKSALVPDDLIISSDDEKGILTITILNHGENKTFTLKEFINTNEFNAKNYLFEMDTESLKNDLEFSVNIKASDGKNLKSIEEIMLAIESNNKNIVLTEEVKNTIKENLITNYNDDDGEVSLIFKIHNKVINFTFDGFVTNNEDTQLKEAIQNLSNTADIRKSLGLDLEKLPSENNLDKNVLLKNLKNLSQINDLRANYQLDVEDLNFNIDDETGVVEVLIKNFGDIKILEFTGFLTNDEKELNFQIQSLTNDEIEENLNFDKSLLASNQVNAKTANDVLMVIKQIDRFAGLEALDKLTPADFEILINDDNGQLKININNHGLQKSLKIISFLTTNEKFLNDTINQLKEEDLFSGLELDLNSKPSAVQNMKTAENILEVLNGVQSFDQLPNEAKNLVIPSDFNLEYNDDLGTFSITINGHGNSKTLVYDGFIKNADETSLVDAIQSLEATNSLAEHFGMNKSALPSDGQNLQTGNSFLNSLLNWEGIASLRLKNRIVESDISIKANDELGTLELVIKNHGSDKTLIFSNFLTKDEADLEFAIQSLNSGTLEKELQIEKDKLPSDDVNAMSNDYLINIIKNLPNFRNLALLDNLVAEDLKIETNDNNGSIKVKIANHGDLKEIIFRDFVTSSENEINQFISNLDELFLEEGLDFDQSKKASDVNNFKQNQKILEIIEQLSSYNEMSESAKKLLVVDDIDFLVNDDLGQITIRIRNHGDSRNLIYSNFVTNDDEVAIEKAIQSLEITEEMNQGLNFDFSKLPTMQNNLNGDFLVTVFQNLNAIKGLKLKNRIERTNLKINLNDDEGVIKIIITGFGNDKILTFNNFINSSGKELQEAVQNLDLQDLQDNFNFNYQELASSINNKKTNEEIIALIKALPDFQGLSGINQLTNSDATIDYNDELGEISISILNHGATKTLIFTGFITEHDDELSVFVEGLNKDDLSENLTFNLDKLPSNAENFLTNTNVFEAIKSLYKFSELSEKAQGIFGENDISISTDDDSGQITISIKHYGDKKNIVYDNFVSSQDFDDLNEAVANLVPSTILSNYFGFDKNRLPSDSINALSARDIVDKIKNTDSFSGLRLKDNLLPENLTVSPNDDEGIVTITISNYGVTKNLVFDHFLNKANKNLNDAIQAISFNDLEETLNFDKNKLPSNRSNYYLSEEVLEKIKQLPNFEDLSSKDLLVKDDIQVVVNDAKGVVRIDIENHGATRSFEFNGFINSSEIEFKTFVKNIDQSELESLLNFNKSELASDRTNSRNLDQLLNAVHALPEFAGLSDEAQFMLAETEIEMVVNDDSGNIEVNLSNELISRKFRFGGFLNKNDFNQLAQAVSKLEINDFDSLNFDKSQLPSSTDNYREKQIVLDTIKSLESFSALKAIDKFTSNHLNINYDDDAGNIIISIEGYGKSKIIKFNGFATVHNESLTSFLKSLTSEDLKEQLKFDYSSKATNTFNEKTAKGILRAIQNMVDFKSLSEEARSLLRINDFQINYNDDLGEIVFKIINHGVVPDIKVSGFISTNDEELLNQAIASLNENDDLVQRLGFNLKKAVDDPVNKKSSSEISKQFQELDEIKDLRLKTKLTADNFKIKYYVEEGKILILITGNGHEKLLSFKGFNQTVKVDYEYKNYLNKKYFSATTTGINVENYVDVPDVNLQFQKGFMFEASDKRIFLSDGKKIYEWANNALKEIETRVNPENGFMYETSDGNFYFGASSGLYKLKENKLVLISNVSMVNGFIYETSQNRKYVGTAGQGLMELKNDKLLSVNSDFSMYDGSMIETSTGRLLIISRGSNLLELEGNSLRYVNNYWFGFNESFIYETSEGVIYFGGSKGLMILKDNNVYRISNADLSKSDMYESADNRIVISSAKYGLLELEGNKLQVVDNEKPKNGFIYETSDGTVYYPGATGLKSFTRKLPSFAKYVYSTDGGETWTDEIKDTLKKGQKVLVNIVNKDQNQTIKWKDGFAEPITLVVNK